MTELTLKKRQEEILEAALEILASEGSHALTIRNLARILGVTEPALYRHFESKKDLLKALYSFAWYKMERILIPAMRGEAPSPKKLESFLCTLFQYLEKNRGVNLVLLSEAIHHNDPQLKEAMLGLIGNVQSLIIKVLLIGVEEGTLKRELDLDTASRMVIGLFQSTVTFSLLKGEPWQTTRIVRSFMEIFMEGVLR